MGPWDLGVHATRNQLLYMHTHTTEACVLPEGYLASSGRGRAVLGEIALWPRASRAVLGEIALCWARLPSGHEHRGIPLACCRPLSWPLAWLLRHGHRLLPACCRGGAQAPCPGSLLKRREEPIADLDADGGDVITVITLLLAPLGRSCLDELRDRLLMRAHTPTGRHAITPIRPAGTQSRPSGRQARNHAHQAGRHAITPIRPAGIREGAQGSHRARIAHPPAAAHFVGWPSRGIGGASPQGK